LRHAKLVKCLNCLPPFPGSERKDESVNATAKLMEAIHDTDLGKRPSAMIRIAISAEAFEAIKATLPLGSIWLERFGGLQAVLRASQGRGGDRHNRLLSRRIRVPLDLQEARLVSGGQVPRALPP
jgi:hypothetical protein